MLLIRKRGGNQEVAKKTKVLRQGDIGAWLRFWATKMNRMRKDIYFPNSSGLNAEAVKYTLSELEKMEYEIGGLIRYHKEPWPIKAL